jgi:hypothetical protein
MLAIVLLNCEHANFSGLAGALMRVILTSILQNFRTLLVESYCIYVQEDCYQLLSDLSHYFLEMCVPLENNKKAFITVYNNAASSMDTSHVSLCKRVSWGAPEACETVIQKRGILALV